MINNIINKIRFSKMNVFNKYFNKYIIKYEEYEDKLKIINSNGDFKIVSNNIPNKVKTMEILREHKKIITKKIENYENKKEDYKIIILSSSFILCVLGCLTLVGFFFGSYELLILAIVSFVISLYLYLSNIFKIFILREENIKLKSILETNGEVFKEVGEFTLSNPFGLLKNKLNSLFVKSYSNKSKI